jgi:hypothetical protein
MKPSTMLALLVLFSLAGVLTALWLLWSPWATTLVLAWHAFALVASRGRESLERGGE